MLQKKHLFAISIIIILTTTIFVSVFVNQTQRLRNYLEYVVENGKSALFFEEFINQKIAFQLSKDFAAPRSQDKDENSQKVCAKIEKVGDILGFNLTQKSTQDIDGTLQTRNTDCKTWSRDLPALADINKTIFRNEGQYSFSNYNGYLFNDIRYYIDLSNDYIYINKLVDTNNYAFNNWLVANGHSINISKSAQTLEIDDFALADLFNGESITSHIYEDGYTQQNIISMITPVFDRENLKGVFITDISIESLAASFFTADRPLLWRFLNLYVTDNNTGAEILFHKPQHSALLTLDHEEEITKYYTLHVKLDYLYILITNGWLIVLYIVSTIMLCKYVKNLFVKHKSQSGRNVPHLITGLYNKEILTPALHEKIQSLIEQNIAITVIAIDSDGLKEINDTRGRHIGDKVIQNLGTALALSIRKSDYGIRLGGDKFHLILIDNTLLTSHEIISRIHEKLAIIDRDKLVDFSYGCYQLCRNDTLQSAFLRADNLLYQHKRDKYDYRHVKREDRT